MPSYNFIYLFIFSISPDKLYKRTTGTRSLHFLGEKVNLTCTIINMLIKTQGSADEAQNSVL